MTYVDGVQMNHGEITIDLMKQSLSVLREFHDIFSKSELSGDEETLLHSDFSPWNLIVKDNKLVGVLDFDDARPGKRIYDVANVCWTFLDIGSSDSNFTEEEVYKYLPILIDAYGDIDTSEFVKALLSEQDKVLRYRENRVKEVDEGEEKEYRKGVCEEIEKEIEWVKINRDNINRAIKERR
jgi:aminoglycoside phosphotransferase (APT) family kinase protein